MEENIIKINDKYGYKLGDLLNVTLCEYRPVTKVNKETGEKTVEYKWRDIAYCRDLPTLLKTVVEREINGSGLTTLQQMSSMYTDLIDFIEEVYNRDRSEIISSAKEEAAIIINDANREAERIKADARNKARRDKK